jgi:two-component system chemotaxis response regulator CheB
METRPVPVVIVTATTNPKEVATLFHAMDAGALAVLPIPAGFGHPEHETTSRELIQTLKSMSEVKVVRRWARGRMPQAVPTATAKKADGLAGNVQVIAIGASTGGPPVLQTILSSLPKDFPFPILIVQHIATGFMDGFVEWLASTCRVPIHIAQHREPLLPGHVYLAPDNVQMGVGYDRTILLRDEPPENGLRPSVSFLFRSVANVFGKNAAGILLTGMGKDGAAELKKIKDAGGITFAQNKETCVVNGMPGEAVRIDAATYVLSPDRIVAVLESIAKRI